MTYNPKSEESFLQNIEKHKMKIHRDEGVHRYIRYRDPACSNYWFEIITWPGCLCINGDCGTYVFQRIHDMFNFFETDGRHSKQKGIVINTGYWAEKCLAQDRHGEIKRFSVDEFNENVRREFTHHYSWDDAATPKEKRECWAALREDVMNPENEWDAYERAMGFSHGRFNMNDFWEYDCKRYTVHYIWCLRAIVWGIKQYRQHHMMQELREMNKC